MGIGPDGLVRRPCTGRLRIPGREEPSFKELTHSLRDQFGEESIIGVQAFGLGRFEVLFRTEELLNNAAEKGLCFANVKHEIEPAESTFKWLYAKYAPFEFDQRDFELHLAPYGDVISMEFVYPEELRPWHNGERKLKFRMKKGVPNFVKMGSYTVHFHYAGVVKLCRKCHRSDHIARECKNNNCRRCGKPGHVEADCGQSKEVNESPETIMKLADKARDDLLKNLRTLRQKRVLTHEDQESEEEDTEEAQDEDDLEQDEGTENEEVEEEESMPELEESEEGDPALETGEEPQSTEDEQDLERKKYLKDKGKNKEEETQGTKPKKSGKKKMSKQERRKRRQTEEQERNKKREREKSESPPTREARIQDGKEGEATKIKIGEKEELHMKVHFEKPGMTYGEWKEKLSRIFEVGVVREIEEEEGGRWNIEFEKDRWGIMVMNHGLLDGDKENTWYPVRASKGHVYKELRYDKEKKLIPSDYIEEEEE